MSPKSLSLNVSCSTEFLPPLPQIPPFAEDYMAHAQGINPLSRRVSAQKCCRTEPQLVDPSLALTPAGGEGYVSFGLLGVS